MSKFTQGPWEIEIHDASFCEVSVYSQDGIFIASTRARAREMDNSNRFSFSKEDQSGWEMDKLNAALIAAAPEMYDEIESALTEIENFGENLHERLACVENLRAVLAKARGKK